MKQRLTFPFALLLVACGDDAPADEATDLDSGVAEVDASVDVAPDPGPGDAEADPDVVEVADVADEPDLTPDAPGDAQMDAPMDADGSGGEDTPDATADGSGEVDVVDEPAADTGTACVDDPSVCVAPYVCITEVCRLPLSGTTWAESTFRIAEPEELTRVLDFLKSLAPGVKFVVVDVGSGVDVLPAEYGTANITDPEADPISVWWQDEFTLGDVTFRPSPTGPLDGDTWATDPFLYALRASATINFPGLEPITADFGLDAERVVFTLVLDPDEPDYAVARIQGVVTRFETEDRVLSTRDGIPGFAALFCSVSGYDPGLDWNLSDVLDCNEAPLDYDLNGDGTLDSYVLAFDAVVEAAQVVEPGL